MYIVAIAWIYVILMMAITENSVTAGILTFLFYGVLPVAVILYLMGTPQRRRNRLQREAEAISSRSEPLQPSPDAPDTRSEESPR